MSGFEEAPIELKETLGLDATGLLQALQTRRSIRRFTKQSVTKEMIDMIIETGRWTPTAKNAGA